MNPLFLVTNKLIEAKLIANELNIGAIVTLNLDSSYFSWYINTDPLSNQTPALIMKNSSGYI